MKEKEKEKENDFDFFKESVIDQDYMDLYSKGKKTYIPLSKKKTIKIKDFFTCLSIVINISLFAYIIYLHLYNKTFCTPVIQNNEQKITINNEQNITINNGKNKTMNEATEKKTIKIQFADFFKGLDIKALYFYKRLEKRYNIEISDNPDYLIFSQSGCSHIKYPNAIKLFWSGENFFPHFLETDYAMGFPNLSFEDRYLKQYYFTIRSSLIEPILSVVKERPYKPNKKFCSFIVTHGGGKFRNFFFKQLSQYKKVDSGGGFMNNLGYKVEDKFKFLADYKFSMCFENSQTPGYLTEKLYDAFIGGTIPIYYGDNTALKFLNPKAFILVKNEEDVNEKIELIKKIDNDEELYKSMLKEKIFLDDNFMEKTLKEYDDFLYNIFDQDKKYAKRISLPSINYDKCCK